MATYFDHAGPGVYIMCRSCRGKRRGTVLIAPEGETFWGPVRDGGSMRSDISVDLADCPDHGALELDSRELADAVSRARRLRRLVPLGATPAR
jgi:hypothetical protein